MDIYTTIVFIIKEKINCSMLEYMHQLLKAKRNAWIWPVVVKVRTFQIFHKYPKQLCKFAPFFKRLPCMLNGTPIFFMFIAKTSIFSCLNSLNLFSNSRAYQLIIISKCYFNIEAMLPNINKYLLHYPAQDYRYIIFQLVYMLHVWRILLSVSSIDWFDQ